MLILRLLSSNNFNASKKNMIFDIFGWNLKLFFKLGNIKLNILNHFKQKKYLFWFSVYFLALCAYALKKLTFDYNLAWCMPKISHLRSVQAYQCIVLAKSSRCSEYVPADHQFLSLHFKLFTIGIWTNTRVIIKKYIIYILLFKAIYGLR